MSFWDILKIKYVYALSLTQLARIGWLGSGEIDVPKTFIINIKSNSYELSGERGIRT